MKPPSAELKLRVISAIDYAPGRSIRDRIISVSKRSFLDPQTQIEYRFTWRTISTWLYRFKKYGVVSFDLKTRSDKNTYRKVQANELSEAIEEILPSFSANKTGSIPKSVLYRCLIEKGYFQRSQLSPTTFYRLIRDNNLLDLNTSKKLRLSFAMQFANELWQADTT